MNAQCKRSILAGDFAGAKVQRDKLESESKRASRILKGASGDCGVMGLASDAVRATLEWKAAARDFAAAFRALQGFNRVYVSRFKQEIQQERSERFGQVQS